MGTVLLGFVGVVLTLRPTIDQNQLFAGVVGLLSGMGAALAYMQVTALGKVGEPEVRTVFYFSVGTVVVGAVGALFTDLTPWSEVSLHGRGLGHPDWRAGVAGPMVHDPRLQPRRHAGGGQHAVQRHRVCRHLQPDCCLATRLPLLAGLALRSL